MCVWVFLKILTMGLLSKCPDNFGFWPAHLSCQPSSGCVFCSSTHSAHRAWKFFELLTAARLSLPLSFFWVLLVTRGVSAFVGSQRVEGWSLCQRTKEANHTHDLALINTVLEPGEPAFHGTVWLWIVSVDLWSWGPYFSLLRNIRARWDCRRLSVLTASF